MIPGWQNYAVTFITGLAACPMRMRIADDAAAVEPLKEVRVGFET